MTGQSFVAKTDCGCVVAAIIDTPERRDDVDGFLRLHVLNGFAVSGMTADEVRAARWVEGWPHRDCARDDR